LLLLLLALSTLLLSSLVLTPSLCVGLHPPLSLYPQPPRLGLLVVVQCHLHLTLLLLPKQLLPLQTLALMTLTLSLLRN